MQQRFQSFDSRIMFDQDTSYYSKSRRTLLPNIIMRVLFEKFVWFLVHLMKNSNLAFTIQQFFNSDHDRNQGLTSGVGYTYNRCGW